MVVNLACLLPQAPLISKELMFYFEGQTTTLFFFLFASCIIILSFFFFFFENFIHKENGGALHKNRKRKKEDISSTQGSCLCRVWEGRLVDSPIFGEVDSRNGGALHIIEKKIGDFFGTTSQSMANTCLAIKMQLLLLDDVATGTIMTFDRHSPISI